MLTELPATQYDVNFKLRGIPVRVHPLFWLTALFVSSPMSGTFSVSMSLIGIAVVFLSVLLHELGHATLGRHFGSYGVRISLNPMCGLACGATGRNWRETIQVLLAGPGASFTLVLAGWCGMKLLQEFTIMLQEPGLVTGLGSWIGDSNVEQMVRFILNNRFSTCVLMTSYHFFNVLYVLNLCWCILNLVPVYPLDGGQVAWTWLEHHRGQRGRVQALKLSIIAGVTATVALLYIRQYIAAILFGYLAYESYKSLMRIVGGGGRGRW